MTLSDAMALREARKNKTHSNEKVLLAVEMRAAGTPVTQIAKELGTSIPWASIMSRFFIVDRSKRADMARHLRRIGWSVSAIAKRISMSETWVCGQTEGYPRIKNTEERRRAKRLAKFRQRCAEAEANKTKSKAGSHQ